MKRLRRILTLGILTAVLIAGSRYKVQAVTTDALPTRDEISREMTRTEDRYYDDFEMDDYGMYTDDYYGDEYDTMTGEEALVMMSVFLIVFAIVLIPVYIYWAITHRKIAQRLGYTHPNWFWVPVLNVIALMQMAGEPAILAFIPIVNIIFTVKAYWKISEKLGYPGWLAIFVLIGPVNLVLYGVWAWADSKDIVGEDSATDNK